ncbi:Uncharacterised protein [Mycobacterium tuberculosis]|nr:Uncharacterised protein [Mycobacterium tuberculosis]
MTHRNGRIFSLKQKRYGFAYDIATPDHNSMLARDLSSGPFDQFNDSVRCAWQKRFIADDHVPNIDRMKAIHIFFRINGIQHGLLGDVRRKWQLNQYPINVRILIQLLDDSQQFSFCGGSLFQYQLGTNPYFLTAFGFSSHIRMRSGIIAHQYNRQTWHYPLFFQFKNFLCQFGTNTFRYFFSLKNSCWHGEIASFITSILIVYRFEKLM